MNRNEREWLFWLGRNSAALKFALKALTAIFGMIWAMAFFAPVSADGDERAAARMLVVLLPLITGFLWLVAVVVTHDARRERQITPPPRPPRTT